MDCLENVIKLSRTECACFDEDKPNDYNEGQSEVYLDELDGINLKLIDAASNCESGNLWEMMALARANATLMFQADLLSAIENNYSLKRPNYSGKLGQDAFTASLNLTGTTAGQIMKFHRIVGGKVIISRIGLAMNASLPITVSAYNNDENSTDPIAAYTINSIANDVAYGVLATPLELPLWSENVADLQYYFVYTLAGFQPKNNKLQCVPCSGGIKNVAWNNWVDIHGIDGSGTDYEGYNRTDFLNGMILDAKFKCDTSRVICSDEYPIDFTSGRGLYIAYAIRFKAGDILLNNILSSSEINRYTMLDREALYGKRNWCRKNYEDYLAYLSANTPNLNNDCWVCKPNNLMSRGTIFT